MAERLPPKSSREPTSEVEVEPDTGSTKLPPPRPLGARDRKPSVPPPPPPGARQRTATVPPAPPAPMPESATPEPSVMLSSDAITLDPGSAPLTEQPTRIVQPAAPSPPPQSPAPPPSRAAPTATVARAAAGRPLRWAGPAAAAAPPFADRAADGRAAGAQSGR